MINQFSEQVPFQNIERGTSTQGQVYKLVSFLEQYLQNFSDGKSLSISSEGDITQEIYKYLQRKKRFNDEGIEYPFEFQPETNQKQKGIKGHPRRADLGVRINTIDINMNLIYCIEAKRLPTEKSGHDREKEYVAGNSGGISRFKLNLHGVTDEGQLIPENGMVGYVQQFNFSHWHTTINDWISKDTDWGNDEVLHECYFSKIGKLESEHLRIGGEKVKLTHFWLVLN